MLTFLSFFVRHTCSLLQCWQDAWTETAPPDISQLKDGGEVMSLPLSVFYPRKIRAQVKLYSSSSSSSFEIARSASPSHPPLSPFRSLSSPSTTAASDPHFPALPPARSPLSFIQFNFEPRTGRQAERGAPWLPGTGPSHYTAN